MLSFVQKLHTQGLRVWLGDNNSLALGYEETVAAELIAELKANKPALLALLEEHQIHSEQAFLNWSVLQLSLLSNAQARLLFVDRLQPQRCAYHIPMLVEHQQADTIAKLDKAIQALTVRHPILNSQIVEHDDQLFCQPRSRALTSVKTRCNDPEQLKALVQTQVLTPFDLSQDAPLRVVHYHCASSTYTLFLWHHIAFDGWSMQLFFKELSQLMADPSWAQQQPLPLSYCDYASWHLTLDQQQAHDYWQTQLKDALPTRLPKTLDAPLNEPLTRGSNLYFTLPDTLSTQLRQLASSLSATPFSVLLSAYYYTLMLFSNQNDILLGVPSDNRDHPQTQDIMGFFVNTLALRAKLDKQASFAQLVTQVKDTLHQAKRHQDLPFDEVVQYFTQGDREQSALQIMFSVQKLASQLDPALSLPFSVSPLLSDDELYQPIKVDLLLALDDSEATISGQIDYNPNRFSQAYIEAFRQTFIHLLECSVAAPHQPLQSHTYVPPGQCLSEPQTQDKPAYDNLYARFVAQAKQTPQASALIYQEQEISYRTLAREVKTLASHIRAQIAQHDDPKVALMFVRGPQMVTAILATLAAGAAYVPLSPTQASSRNQFILNDSGAALLLTQSQLAAQAQQLAQSDATPVLTTEALLSDPAEYDLAQGDAGQLAYVIYTSGSTGQPKGVMVEHGHVDALVRSTSEVYQFASDERTYWLTPYFFDASVEPLFMTLLNGACLVIPCERSCNDPLAMREEILDRAVTHLVASPSHLQAIGHCGKASAIRRVVFGGESCSQSLVDTWQQRLFSEYGPTEATVTATVHRQFAQQQNLKAIGQPLRHVTIDIVDDALASLPVGCPGEILISGHSVARGYLNLPEQTEARFITTARGRAYRTGDMARRLPCGNLEFMGRNDAQVKLRGYRIELNEIEVVLLKHPDIEQACVKVQTLAQGPALVAYLGTTSMLTLDELLPWLNERLPDYMHPAALQCSASLPLLPSGKVDARALAPLDISVSTTYVAPQSALEKDLCALWAEHLGVEQVGMQDSFFALGGNSLSAMTLVAKMQRTLALPVTLKALLSHKTPAAILANLDTQHRIEPIPVLADPTQPVAVTPQQQAMLLSERLATTAGAYHIPLMLSCGSLAQQQALMEGVQQVISRHQILQQGYDQDEQGHWFISQTRYPVPCQVLALQSHNDSALQEFVNAPFTLDTSAPVRVAQLRVGPLPSYRLLLVFHHVAFDGWSVERFIRELDQQMAGQVLTPSTLTYRDYAHWRSTLDEQAELDYWQQAFAGIDLTPWESDFSRSASYDPQGKALSFTLPDALTRSLRALAQQQGVSLYATLLSSFQLAACFWADRDDIVIGTPSDNRAHPDSHELMGYFVNTLALPLRLDSTLSFTALMKQVQTQVHDAKSHQGTSVDVLADALNIERQSGLSPLFQLFFTLDQFNPLTQAFNGFEVIPENPQDYAYTPAKFEWNMVFKDDGDQLQGQFTYATTRYDATRCEQFLAFYQVLLNNLMAAPEQPVRDCPLLSHAQFQTLVTHQAQQSNDPHTNWLACFAQACERAPHNIALSFEDQQLSYGELDSLSSQLAATLHQHLGTPGAEPARVALHFHKGCDMIIAMLATLKAGAAFVALSPNHPQARRETLLQQAQCELLLSDDALSWSTVPTLLYHWRDWPETQTEHNDINFNHSPDRLAYLIYTSGTTGTPKGAMLSHRGLINLSAHMMHSHRLIGQSRQVVASQYAEYVFDASIIEIFPALAAGARLEIIPEPIRRDVPRLCEFLRRQHVDVAFVPTVLVNQFADLLAECQLDVLFVGGAPLNPVHQRLANTFYNEYGLSETSVCVTQAEVTPQQPITIGRAIRNTRLYVLDKYQRPVPPGGCGELHSAGCSTGLGYWQNADKTAAHFITLTMHHGAQQLHEQVYRTGDLVRRVDADTLQFVARTDQQLEINGYRIEPGEIEAKLLTHPDVGQAVVCQVQGHAQQLIAYCVLNQSATSPVADSHSRALLNWLNAQLPPYMRPKHLLFVSHFPLTLNGKLDLKQLPQPELDQLKVEQRAPQTQTEQTVLELCQRLLGVSELNINHDFFELGGSSVQAARLIAECEKAFVVNIELATLLTHPVLAEFAAAVDRLLAEQAIPDAEFEMEL
ncbi:non-ribosomal peptide synthetase [Pseudoalteromonas rubra]|uniref:Carrier domain-containing protein n=1 Tax=Pseudoalteromonas rubra TaxID=43658 RepID=A0A0F4QE16_9GAMM|nr:non-ribosomal peptide synthetase [Pseudoalteromonas rubra]KJZ05958.1 hypothetical protein TW77_20980 [Pseudoalteromonas rubra]